MRSPASRPRCRSATSAISARPAAARYRITDPIADPSGEADDCHVERLIRLPRTLWCFAPWPEMPEPVERAASGYGRIVFGSFNRLTKIHRPVLRAWARILARVPDAELWILDVPSPDDRQRLLAPLREEGIDDARITTFPRQARTDYWKTICAADIALDPFPYTGGATTCECLWLGVPVVTRAGAMGFARSGATILHNAGLSELVADSEDAYVEIAVGLASDRVRLRELQRGLRERLRASPLMDAPAFMRDLEAAYRGAWRAACAAS